MELAEWAFGLSDVSGFGITDVVVLNNSKLFIFLIVSLVADTDQHEAVLSSLPHGVHGYLDSVHSIGKTDLLLEFPDIEFSVGIISEIIGFELPFIIVSGFEPGHHWVMIGLLNDVLISPFIVLWAVYVERLVVLLGRIIIITELESIVIVSAIFLNT